MTETEAPTSTATTRLAQKQHSQPAQMLQEKQETWQDQAQAVKILPSPSSRIIPSPLHLSTFNNLYLVARLHFVGAFEIK